MVSCGVPPAFASAAASRVWHSCEALVVRLVFHVFVFFFFLSFFFFVRGRIDCVPPCYKTVGYGVSLVRFGNGDALVSCLLQIKNSVQPINSVRRADWLISALRVIGAAVMQAKIINAAQLLSSVTRADWLMSTLRGVGAGVLQ